MPAAVAIAVVAMAVWWFLRPEPGPPIETVLPTAAEVDPGPAPTVGAPLEPTTTTGSATIVAHAAGAVLHPGVVTVSSPARVADVVAAAGGLLADADADRINLAAPVTDGDRVFVPLVGQTDIPSVAPGAGGGSGVGVPSATSDTTVDLIDLNTADQVALESLPGVGPATALAILAHRDDNGPFVRIEDLLEVRGIGPAKLDQLRPFVTVG